MHARLADLAELIRATLAVAFSLAAVASFGAGHVLVSRPHEAELARLRQRVELLDFVAQHVLMMTPAERRQFDALINGNDRRR